MQQRNLLSKATKRQECLQQIEKQVEQFKTDLAKKLDTALASGAIPEYMYEEGNHLLTMALVFAYCKEGAKPGTSNKAWNKDFENIYVNI